MSIRALAALLLTAAALAAAGCGGTTPASAPADSAPPVTTAVTTAPPATTEAATTTTATETVDPLAGAGTDPVSAPSKVSAEAGPALLERVALARHEGFDRVVFQFDGETLPGYRVEYLDGPAIRCGSGDPTEVAGQGRLQVSLQPAQAHDENGQATVASRERAAALPVLQELEQTCDFEGEVIWVLGVKQPQAYCVLELHAPTRIVVDVRH
jgi:hypothetical protein